jgi:hypothetical protein
VPFSPAFLDELRRRTRLTELIGRRVKLVRRGREHAGLCPFHHEKTPSFYVVEEKRFWHCFGCGAHGDAIGFVMRADNLDFEQAVQKLAGGVGQPDPGVMTPPRDRGTARPPAAVRAAPAWAPILPVPDDAPALLRPDGWTVELINPKQAGTPKERTRYRPVLRWPYRDAAGRLLGYVLRIEFERDGRRKKFTPPITFCAGPGGARRWCVVAFPAPRPLYGLSELAARPEAPVIVAVEGEKTCNASRRLLPGYVVVTWPGGSNSIAHVDWHPLTGRDVLLLLDNDDAARKAADGRIDPSGDRHPGIAELLAPIARRVRVVDPPADLEEGWDLADAEAEGWSQADAGRWLLAHLRPAAAAIPAPVERVAEPIIRKPTASSPTRTGSPWNRRRLEELVGKVGRVDQARLKRRLVRTAGLVANAVRNGEIRPEVAEAVLARAAAQAGLEESEARRLGSFTFRTAGEDDAGEG